jgi:hypothetical protein
MDTLTTVFDVAGHVRHVVIDDRTVLMDLNKGVYLGLDDVGTAIWTSVGQSLTGEAIADRLREHYDVAPSVARTDVERLLGELRQRGLLVPAPRGGGVES